MRNTLTPAFTGSKLRQTFSLMNQVAQQACDYLREEQKQSHNAEGVELELKAFAKRFTSDVIATTAFGVQVNSFKDAENEFYVTGMKMTTFTFWQNIKYILFTNFGRLCKLLKIDLFEKKYTDFYMNLVLNTMKQRQQNNIIRPDLIQMLMEARGLVSTDNIKLPKHEWTDTEMVAQCLLFYFAGYDTVASLVSFAGYELMANPAIQDKLLQEIRTISSELAGAAITYEALQKMTYLDMITSEVLRKWPGTLAVDRVCNKDITYDLENGEKLHIKAGEAIWFPINALHMDAKYWREPTKFDPERFSAENKDKIKTCTYMPFGVGPRNCIGSRFALLEAKALLFYLIRDFRIEASEKLCNPFKLSTSVFELQPEGGFWLKLIAREEK